MKGYDDEWLSKYYSGDPVFVKCIRYCADREELEKKNLQIKDQEKKVNLVAALSVSANARQSGVCVTT